MVMRSCFLVLTLCLIAGFAWADVEAPVKFTSVELMDLGNFHGEKPANENAGWGFWGAREPIVTPDWVVFPFPGKYRFIIDSESHQLVPEDTKKGIFAEIDLTGRFHGLNGVKKLAEDIATQQQGEVLILHTRVKADEALGERFTEILEAGTADPEGKVIINDDQTTGIIEFEAGMKAQLAIWFTNDEWQPDPPPAKDRNLRVFSLEVLLPENINLAVDPKDKLATTWAMLKTYR